MPVTARARGKVPHALPRPKKEKRAMTALVELRELVASEGYAMTALTLAGYRRDLLSTFDDYIKDCAA